MDVPTRPESGRWKALAGAALFALILIALFALAGRPMLKIAAQPEEFRALMDSFGAWGRVAFIGMMALQIVVAVIPGEPLEIAAGYAFGAVEGTALCLLGALLGGTLVFAFVRTWGRRAAEVFFPRERIDSLRILRDKRHLCLALWLAFLLPGTPKDLLTYGAGLTRISLGRWMLITSLGRIPSVVTSTVGGEALGMGRYGFAALVFALTLALCAAGLLAYRRMNAAKDSPRSRA